MILLLQILNILMDCLILIKLLTELRCDNVHLVEGNTIPFPRGYCSWAACP